MVDVNGQLETVRVSWGELGSVRVSYDQLSMPGTGKKFVVVQDFPFRFLEGGQRVQKGGRVIQSRQNIDQ